MSERVILAYSGGLDTSVAISWIGKETGKEVVAVAIDLGQGGEEGSWKGIPGPRSWPDLKNAPKRLRQAWKATPTEQTH